MADKKGVGLSLRARIGLFGTIDVENYNALLSRCWLPGGCASWRLRYNRRASVE